MDSHQKKTLCFPDDEQKLHHLLSRLCVITANTHVNQAEKQLLQLHWKLPTAMTGIRLTAVLQADTVMTQDVRQLLIGNIVPMPGTIKSNTAKEAELTQWPVRHNYHGCWHLWLSLRLFQHLKGSQAFPEQLKQHEVEPSRRPAPCEIPFGARWETEKERERTSLNPAAC